MTEEIARKFIESIPPDQAVTLPGPEGSPFVRNQFYSEGPMWVGVVTTEPGGASPWHHHGEHTTFAYLLEGEATVEYGDGGSESVRVLADGTLHVVPPGLVHREVNSGATKNKFLIIRFGEGAPVFPAEDPTSPSP
jgi:uncharacterized RmlC-like cupin family protein